MIVPMGPEAVNVTLCKALNSDYPIFYKYMSV